MDGISNDTLNASILVVDDIQDNVDLIEMMLSFAGYTNVQSTTDSREVKGLYEDNDFDLILLDIRMPYLDGFQVMEQLSDAIKGDYLPILVLTAENDMTTRLKALKVGAKDFVTKPFDQAETLNRIHNMLEVRFLYSERMKQNEILESKVKERTIELQLSNEELKNTRLQIIRRLGRAGEFRDHDTGLHVLRMSISCHKLALLTGLEDSHAEQVLYASPMHDVGKIGIPDAILLKPGKLDEDEWEIMKGHALIGGEIIGNQDAPLMQLARSIAVTHHEKWDGSGYPHGLKADEIPIEGRIASICDVFDALLTERPYKKPWSVEEVIAYLNEQAGEQFDPNLVRIFIEAIPEFLEIRERHTDPDP